MLSAADGSVFLRGFFASVAAEVLGTRFERTPVLADLALLGFGFDVIDFVMVFFLYKFFKCISSNSKSGFPPSRE
jgi:hypothetical protein